MARMIKQIDTYDIWDNEDGSYTVNAEEGGHTRLVGSVDTYQAAMKILRRDMAGN